MKLTPGSVLGHLDEKSEWPEDVEDLALPVFDQGVFINELAKNGFLPAKLSLTDKIDQLQLQSNPGLLQAKAEEQAPDSLTEGTWHGTQLALTKIYDLIEKRYVIQQSGYSKSAPGVDPTCPTYTKTYLLHFRQLP